MLAAGIDVYSTVNVQHLESLNDTVAELTGVRVRETLPDTVLSAADEVVLVDLTPPALIERLRAGKVYRPERVASALNGFFRVENLEALREVALRQVAEDVEHKRLREVVAPREDRLITQSAPQAVGERLLALVTLQPSSQRVVRRAWRSAQRLGAELDVLTVLPPTRDPSPAEREQLDALHRLGSLLGVRVIEETGDDLADVVARVVRDRGTTYVLMGTPRPRTALRRLGEPLVDGLLRRMPGVDVRIVADRSQRDGSAPMIAALLIALTFVVGTAAGGIAVRLRLARRARVAPHGDGRILFPFVGTALSERALEACLRLAHAEHAVLVPAYLVPVPMAQHLDAPLPRACDTAFELLETIEQRATHAGVAVDARIGRGRSLRHAMRQLMATERFDRIVVPAGGDDFTADDVAWLLRHADGEVVVLRPADNRFLRARTTEPDIVPIASGLTGQPIHA